MQKLIPPIAYTLFFLLPLNTNAACVQTGTTMDCSGVFTASNTFTAPDITTINADSTVSGAFSDNLFSLTSNTGTRQDLTMQIQV